MVTYRQNHNHYGAAEHLTSEKMLRGRHPAFLAFNPENRGKTVPIRNRVGQRELSSVEVGNESFGPDRNVSSCRTRHILCKELKESETGPHCEYYGCDLITRYQRPQRCAECVRCRGK